jgi:WD40 repeat protein
MTPVVGAVVRVRTAGEEHMTHLHLIQTLTEHHDTIRDLRFSSDGRTLASLSIITDNRVVVWDTTPWAPLQQWYSGAGTTTLAFAPSGRHLFGTGVSQELYIWDVQRGTTELLPTPFANGWVVFRAHGYHLMGCCAGVITMVDLAHPTNRITRQFPESQAPLVRRCGWWNRSAGLLFIQNHGYELCAYDFETQQLVHHYHAHQDAIIDVDFCQQRSLMISLSLDGMVCVWDMVTGALRTKWQSSQPEPGEIYSHPVQPLVAIVNAEDWIELFNYETGTIHAVVEHPGGQRCLAFSPDGSTLVTGGEDGMLRIWRM